MKNFIVILLFIISVHCTTNAQDAEAKNKYANTWTVVAGLSQPILLHGGNLAGSYFSRNLTFEYSHGMFLHLEGSTVKDKHVHSIYVPVSTGLGIGYRITGYLDIRGEVKLHRFEVQLNATQKIKYTNIDLGAGAYYRIYPFQKKDRWAKGILIEPSLRYWQFVRSTLKNKGLNYVDDGGEMQTHHPYNFGLFANISIGYTFK
jgi:hypothetical protein